VTLSPHTKSYGGLGNVILSLVGVQAFAFPLRRVALLNVPLFEAMFSHPDSPRQKNSRQFVSAESVNENKKWVSHSPNCQKIFDIPLRNVPIRFGVNMCWFAFITHRESVYYYNQLLGPTRKIQHFGYRNISYFDWTFNSLGGWIMSNPTVVFKQHALEYQKKISSERCQKIHLALQIRTWRDVREGKLLKDSNKSTLNNKSKEASISFEELGGECFLNCTYASINAFIRARENDNRLVKDQKANEMCVFVTSDNDAFSQQLVQRINSQPQPSKITMTAFSAVPASSSSKPWHSFDLIKSSLKKFNSSLLVNHPLLFDWYLLGEATTSVYTSGSTFGSSARLRAGLENQLNDFKVAFREHSRECICEKVFP